MWLRTKTVLASTAITLAVGGCIGRPTSYPPPATFATLPRPAVNGPGHPANFPPVSSPSDRPAPPNTEGLSAEEKERLFQNFIDWQHTQSIGNQPSGTESE